MVRQISGTLIKIFKNLNPDCIIVNDFIVFLDLAPLFDKIIFNQY